LRLTSDFLLDLSIHFVPIPVNSFPTSELIIENQIFSIISVQF